MARRKSLTKRRSIRRKQSRKRSRSRRKPSTKRSRRLNKRRSKSKRRPRKQRSRRINPVRGRSAPPGFDKKLGGAQHTGPHIGQELRIKWPNAYGPGQSDWFNAEVVSVGEDGTHELLYKDDGTKEWYNLKAWEWKPKTTVKDLREWLKANGLPITGNKEDLMARKAEAENNDDDDGVDMGGDGDDEAQRDMIALQEQLRQARESVEQEDFLWEPFDPQYGVINDPVGQRVRETSSGREGVVISQSEILGKNILEVDFGDNNENKEFEQLEFIPSYMQGGGGPWLQPRTAGVQGVPDWPPHVPHMDLDDAEEESVIL